MGEDLQSDQDGGTFLIEVKCADDFVELHDKKISLIKIDVEGHELAALKGTKNLIKKIIRSSCLSNMRQIFLKDDRMLLII